MPEANAGNDALFLIKLLVTVVTIGLAACGGAPTVSAVEAPAPKPRNAAAIAQSIVQGKTSVMLYVDRARSHPLMPKVLALDVVRSALEGTGIDPAKDLRRVFVTSVDVRHEGEEIAVLEHSVEEPRLHAAIDELIGRSTPSGAWLPTTSVPEARVTIRGRTRILAMVLPDLLVVLPEARAADAAHFEGTAGLADPTGDEAAIATAVDPGVTLHAPHVPAIPASLRSAEARVFLTGDGGARIDFDGASSSADQAISDAADLTRVIDEATSVRVAILTVRVFRQIPFHAEGDHVKSELVLTPRELDTLLGLAAALGTR